MAEKADKRAKRRSLPAALIHSVMDSGGGGEAKESKRALLKASQTSSGETSTGIELSDASRLSSAVRTSSSESRSSSKKDKRDKKEKRASRRSVEEPSTTQSCSTATPQATEEVVEVAMPRVLERPRSATFGAVKPTALLQDETRAPPLNEQQRQRLDSHGICEGRYQAQNARVRMLEGDNKMMRIELSRLAGEVSTLHALYQAQQRIDIQERLAAEERDAHDAWCMRLCFPCLF